MNDPIVEPEEEINDSANSFSKWRTTKAFPFVKPLGTHPPHLR